MEAYPEVRDLLLLLIAKGFTLNGYEDPEADVTLVPTDDIDKIVAWVHAVDEGVWVDVELNGVYTGLFFVLGNEPGVALNDWTYNNTTNDLIEEALDEINTKYN